MPVALKALRSAQAHQPFYIDGVGLKKRKYGRSYVEHFRAELPPPLFLAVAHGNVAVCKALIEAGCDVNLLQGQSVCGIPLRDEVNFKIHKKCVRLKRRFGSTLKCVCQWKGDSGSFNDNDAPGCQTAGHVAIRYEKAEMLNILLKN